VANWCQVNCWHGFIDFRSALSLTQVGALIKWLLNGSQYYSRKCGPCSKRRRVTPTGYSGHLNRTMAITDVWGFACLALNQSALRIIGPPSGSVWLERSGESTQPQYAFLLDSELVFLLFDMLISILIYSCNYVNLITLQCALATSIFILDSNLHTFYLSSVLSFFSLWLFVLPYLFVVLLLYLLIFYSCQYTGNIRLGEYTPL
jgi:hypothetical protein